MSWSSLTVTPTSASNVSTSPALIVVSSAPVMIGALFVAHTAYNVVFFAGITVVSSTKVVPSGFNAHPTNLCPSFVGNSTFDNNAKSSEINSSNITSLIVVVNPATPPLGFNVNAYDNLVKFACNVKSDVTLVVPNINFSPC